MNLYSEHCWCSKSNWNDDNYVSSYKVTIDSHPEVLGLDFFKDEPCNDYKELVHEKEVFIKEEHEYYINNVNNKKEKEKEDFFKEVPFLNENAIKWLENNIKDKKNAKGWCIGNDYYREKNAVEGIDIWFKRKSDAINFIKKFSEFKKPLVYYDSFKEERKYLNIKTNKYVDDDFENLYNNAITY